MASKKSQNEMSSQLGMNIGTASNALRKSVLFDLIQKAGLDYCYRCGAQIDDIKDLSIEHKIPWLHSENPVELFFDLDNIAFSHRGCNSAAGRKPSQKYFSESERNKAKREWERENRVYDPAKRKEQYRRTGK